MSARPLVRSLATLCAALFAAGAPFRSPLAFADEGPKVAVAPFHVINQSVDASLGQRAAEVLADELRSQDGILLAAPAPAPTPAPSADASATPDGAKSALSAIMRGEGLVRRLKLRSAVDTLTQGIQDYESFPSAVDVRKLREAYIQLAVAHSRLGENDAAGEALASAVRISPEARLSGPYPPVFKKAFNDAHREVMGGPRANVSISGDGQVELDGRKLGAAPTQASGIPVGAHFLRATRSDGSVWGVKLLLNEGDNSASIPAPAGAAVALATKGPSVTADAPGLADLEQNQLDTTVLAAAAKLGKQVGADFVVIGGVYKSGDGVGVASHLYSVRARAAVALPVAHVDADLVSAGIEINKVAVDIAKKANSFPRPFEAVPGPVASELVKPAVAVVTKKHDDDTDTEVKTPIVKPPPDDKKVVVVEKHDSSQPDLRIVTPPDKSAGGLGEGNPDTGTTEVAPVESHAWIWGVVGGAVLAGAAVGGYVLYRNSQQPVTGTATLNFQ